jgi:hypothetical protein
MAWSGMKWLEIIWNSNDKMYKILETINWSETGPYPSDLDGVGCNQNGKMPHGPRDGPEAWNGQMDIVFIDVR